MPGGQPQVTPVWVDFDGRHVLFNTAEGRQKDKNLQRDGRVALSILDPDNPYRYLEVRGQVAERTHAGADQHIDLPWPRSISAKTNIRFGNRTRSA